MTDIQKKRTEELRLEGQSYSKIAEELGLPVSAVKSHCVRNKEQRKSKCEYCGKIVAQDPKRKHKRFCSDHCRNSWWNERPELVNRNKACDYMCRCCGKVFRAYEKEHRKYCSRDCYYRVRFSVAL